MGSMPPSPVNMYKPKPLISHALCHFNKHGFSPPIAPTERSRRSAPPGARPSCPRHDVSRTSFLSAPHTQPGDHGRARRRAAHSIGQVNAPTTPPARKRRLLAIGHRVGSRRTTMCEGWTTAISRHLLHPQSAAPDAAAAIIDPKTHFRLHAGVQTARGRDSRSSECLAGARPPVWSSEASTYSTRRQNPNEVLR